MKVCKILYNKAIFELNNNQGINHLGIAKGSKELQFQTLWGRVYGWDKTVPAKLQHSTIHRAYKAWASSKKEKNSKLKLAEFYTGKYFTLETSPEAYKKGKLYPKFWGNLSEFSLRYGHKETCLVGSNCLTIYYKYGRFYLSQPNKVTVNKTSNSRVIAIDPGIRSFATMFDGSNGYQITNEEDIERIAKLQAYASKLHKRANSLTNWFDKKKVFYKISRLKRKVTNLVKDFHRKLACYLAKNYDVIYIPNYKVKSIYKKGKQNKTNRKNQLNWAWYKFTEELQYRCALYSSGAIKVSEAYTSKTCSKCGYIHHRLGSNKLFNCPKCNHSLSRDLNGAINILHNSLHIHMCL